MESQTFLNEYCLNKKIAFVITGGGISVNDVLKTPGASKKINSIYTPYSWTETIDFFKRTWNADVETAKSFIDEFSHKAVSEFSAKNLCKTGTEIWKNCLVVSCTAALTTERYRKGQNQAFVSIGTPEKITTFHMMLDKISIRDFSTLGQGYFRWKRAAEDKEIADFILKKIVEYQNEF